LDGEDLADGEDVKDGEDVADGEVWASTNGNWPSMKPKTSPERRNDSIMNNQRRGRRVEGPRGGEFPN
jgi:hypothetical protein